MQRVEAFPRQAAGGRNPSENAGFHSTVTMERGNLMSPTGLPFEGSPELFVTLSP
jgi:hypothetical protein